MYDLNESTAPRRTHHDPDCCCGTCDPDPEHYVSKFLVEIDSSNYCDHRPGWTDEPPF